MASKFTIGTRVRVAGHVDELSSSVGVVDWIGPDRFPDACGVLLDDDPDQMSAHFYDHELTDEVPAVGNASRLA